MRVSIETLRAATRRAILAQGYDDADSDIILDIIMYAQLRGNNQNVIKLLRAGMQADPRAGDIRLVTEGKLSALIVGGWTHGMVDVSSATARAI